MFIFIIIVALVLFFLTFGIMRIVDAKKEINRNLCDEKIRYAKEKAEIWLETEVNLLKKKKELGFPPGGGSSPKWFKLIQIKKKQKEILFCFFLTAKKFSIKMYEQIILWKLVFYLEKIGWISKLGIAMNIYIL